jgi:hypothetical protein
MLSACADPSSPSPGGPPSPATDADAAPADAPSADAAAMPDAGPTYQWMCDRPRPEGAPQPDPLPTYSGGTCPVLMPGMNTIISTGHTRQFILVVPANLTAGERLPLLFMWYWIGGSAQGFVDKGEVQMAADQQRFLAIVPVSEGALLFGKYNLKWPFDITQPDSRMQEEYGFFDDMLACAAQQFNVNQDCVSTIGVSAGGLFSDQLAQARSTRLASFVSLSGGVGGVVKPWSGATHRLPGLVLWGGDGPPNGVKDILGCFGIGMDFSAASHQLEDNITTAGQFMIECIHNCGHVEPPLEAPPGESQYAGLWKFMLDHPYWLAPGTSPYQQSGLPSGLPAWCAIGEHSATPRMGPGCPMPENPCAF